MRTLFIGVAILVLASACIAPSTQSFVDTNTGKAPDLTVRLTGFEDQAPQHLGALRDEGITHQVCHACLLAQPGDRVITSGIGEVSEDGSCNISIPNSLTSGIDYTLYWLVETGRPNCICDDTECRRKTRIRTNGKDIQINDDVSNEPCNKNACDAINACLHQSSATTFAACH